MWRWWWALLMLVPSLALAGAEATHPHVCTGTATPSTSDIDCPDWNAAHTWGGTSAAQGTLPYYDTGETTKLNWSTEMLYDETTLSLKLFGGGLGTNGDRILSLGCANTTDPTTSPADTVQVYCVDLNGAGTAGLVARTEVGGGVKFYDGTDSVVFTLGATTVMTVSRAFALYIGGTPGFKVADGTGAFGVYDNFQLGDPDSGFGTGAAATLAQMVGTCPSSSPADMVQTCVQDRNGAATATAFIRDEEGHLESHGAFVHARSTNENTVTSGTSDLHTLNTNVSIPVTDGARILFSWRKYGAGTGTVSLGIKINTTQIIPNLAVTASDTTARTGYCEIVVWNRATSYLRSIGGTCYNSSGGAVVTTPMIATADMTVTPITSIIVTGVGSAANVSLGVRDVVVQRIAGY